MSRPDKPTTGAPVVRLTQWSVCIDRRDPYTAPERCYKYLKGYAEGHPKFEDGDSISTSWITDAAGAGG